MKTTPILRSWRRVSVAAGILLSGLSSSLHADDFPSDMLPPPTGTLDATQVMTFGTMPQQFKDFSVRLPSSSIAPPAPGTSSTVTFSATVHARASNNGGALYLSVAAPCTVTMSLQTSSDGSTCDAEITELSCPFSAAVEIRESPTLPSLGRFSIERCADGTCRIDSFFDVFTELRAGQGQSTFTPSSSSTHFVCRAPSSENPFSSPNLPPVASVHRSAATVTYANGVMLRCLSVSNPASPAAPPAPGSMAQYATQATCSGEISTDGGATFQHFECPASLVMRATSLASGPPAGSPASHFDTEMLSLSLSGGSLPGTMMVRESPTKASHGRTSSRQAPDGSHRIGSFFDIFTEVSLDGGQNWSPSSTGACVCALGRDHSFATDSFPFAGDYACATGDLTNYGTSGLVMRGQKIRLLPGTREPLMAQGLPETRTLDGEMTCDVSRDGGATFSRVVVACAVSVGVSDVGLSSGSKSLEILSLTCSLPSASSGGAAGGAPPVMVRESPTKQSTGPTRVCTCPSGYMVSSFFDVFTEISLDGGVSWAPASTALHFSLVPYVEQDNVFASAYALPRDGSFEMRPDAPPISCDALTQDYLKRKLNVWLSPSSVVSSPLYDSSDHSVNPLFGSCSCEVSSDNGVTWTRVTGTATGSVAVSRVTHGDDSWGAKSLFDTEMLSLSLGFSSGGTTPFSMKLRESPTLKSTGQTTVKRLADGSACRMDSFFDVFTELSLDGGATWSPTASAAHLELHAAPDECFTPSPRLPVATCLTSSDPEFRISAPNGHVTVLKIAFDFSDSPPGTLLRVAPPAIGASVVCDSTVPVSFEYCPEGSTAFTRVECDAAVSCSYTRAADGSLSCEMLSCVFSGGSLPAALRLRESPTRPSLGIMTIRESPSGQLVSGFFDIFVELSTDGGTVFDPACSPVRVECRASSNREASAPSISEIVVTKLVSQPIELLPRLRIGSAVLRCDSPLAISPPAAGSSATRIETGTMDFLYCPEGSTTASRLHGDMFLRYEMKEVVVSSYCTSFDTEMLQMECSGLPAGMRLRESPTLPSKGKTCIYPQPDGSCRVSSFFDIFTELSLDGGKTWSALDLPLHYAFENAEPSSGSPDNAWPPPGQFQHISGDPDFDLLFADGSAMGFFDIFTELSVGRPTLPPVGSAPLETTSTGRCRLQLAGPGGPVDQDCDVAFTTRLTATGTFSDGSTCYDTEMLSLSLSSGSGLPLAVMVRESPTRASIGQTRCRSASSGGGGSGGCAVDCFFDVFTELSYDGGATWSPADAPMRVVFVSAEIDVSTPQGTAIADTSEVTVNANIASTLSLDIAGFVVRNTGTCPLSGFSFSFTGADAALFSCPNPPLAPLPPGGSTAFKVAFVSPTPGLKTATLHLTSNDADESSFEISFSVRVLMPDEDADDDGLSNEDEVALATCGFDPLAESSSQTDVFRDNGFFRASDMHALALGRPVLERSATTGHFHLRLGISESPTLQSWSALTNFTPTFDAPTGTIDLDIPPSGSDKRFYQVLGQEP